MRATLGSLQSRDIILMIFLHFFKAHRQKKITIKITLVDTKFKMRISKFFSSHGFVQVTWHIIRKGIGIRNMQSPLRSWKVRQWFGHIVYFFELLLIFLFFARPSCTYRVFCRSLSHKSPASFIFVAFHFFRFSIKL